MEILIGQDYASATHSRSGLPEPHSVKRVRVLEIHSDKAIVKLFPEWPTSTRGRNVSEKIRRETKKSFGIDPWFDAGTRGEVYLDSLICLWKDWPEIEPRMRKDFEDRRSRIYSFWGASGRKQKWRKGRYLKGGVWDESTKENRTISNRRDRHKNKIQIHTNMKKHN